MNFTMMGIAIAAEKPAAAASWFRDNFGFTIGVDLGWYVSTQRTDHPNVSLDFVQSDHPSWPASTRGKAMSGTLLAFLVEDVDAEFSRLTASGLEIVKQPITEPWGQRRFQVAGPFGLIVEVLQSVAPDAGWLADHGFAG